jgi:hypothetical protein
MIMIIMIIQFNSLHYGQTQHKVKDKLQEVTGEHTLRKNSK